MTTKSHRHFLLALIAAASLAIAVCLPGMAPCASAGQAVAPAETPAEAASSIAYLSATEQIKRFKAGTLSPVDVLKAQIERIQRYNGPLNTSGDQPADFMKFNGKINAITYEHFDTAMKAAQEAEQRYKDGTARALEGITVAVKDENDVEGWRVTMGSLLMKDAPPCEENTAIIDKLLAEGAILHIQTTVPELYLHGQTWSRLWGVTRNPWNLAYATGGSSGGSGAALAAGFTTLATGSDMGGSIRIPASFCGLYGFKPPFGRVPTSDISFETLGPLARTFEDMALMQNVISGPSPKVHAALRPKLDYPQQYGDLKGVKIAVDYFGDWVEAGLEDSVRRSLDEAVATLRSQGAEVTEVKLGWKSDDIYTIFFNGLLSTAMGDMLLQVEGMEDQMTSYAASFLKQMDKMGPGEMALSDDLATKLHRQLQEQVFEKGYQALIMPTMATARMLAENDPTVDVVTINGKPVKGLQFGMTYIWNLLSRYPVVSVPIGFDEETRVPIGMQVVGNTFDDLGAFQVAHGYSTAGVQLYQGDVFPDNE